MRRNPTPGDPADVVPVPGDGPSLDRIVLTLGPGVAEVLRSPRVPAPIGEILIAAPDEPAPAHAAPGDLVLLVGLRGTAAVPALERLRRTAATAVAVKLDPDDDAGRSALLDAVAGADLGLVSVRPEMRWEQAEALVRQLVEDRPDAAAPSGVPAGDLFAIAHTTAALTGGLVSIEDTANRVLAYSASGDDVDELRRLSILGRQGPESYLALLREWGVYHRLREGEDVVEIEARPDLAIRRRLAVGIHAGHRTLGFIWVQEADHPMHAHAGRALVGAARVAAAAMARTRTDEALAARSRERLVAALVRSPAEARDAAAELGLGPGTATRGAGDPAGTPGGRAATPRAATVVLFDLPETGDDGAHDDQEGELGRGDLVNLVSVHAASFRRASLTTRLGARICLVLPSGDPAVVEGLVRDILDQARRHLRRAVRAAVGSTAAEPGELPRSRRDAERVLAVMAPGEGLATFARDAARAVLAETVAAVAGDPGARLPGVAALVAADREHGTALVASLRAYLDRFGDVRAAAADLAVHPNTVRYRVRRACAVAGVDLDDPAQRLVTELLLRVPGAAGPVRRSSPTP